MSLQPGSTIHNRYKIVRLLEQGGFGAIYQAWDNALSRRCAIKENLERSSDSRRQFENEAKILADLSHPGLPRVVDYFVIPGQGQYLVMDFVEGRDLQDILEEQGEPLDEKSVLKWGVQICEALEYLHTRQPPIIHRDIKPANIKITPAGNAVLVDFGIAKVYAAGLKTTMGARAVTPGYSPHEQYGKGSTDARTDIYALGAALYALLTASDPPESIDRVVRDPLVPPRKVNPRLSEATEKAILKSLSIDPSDRFQNAREFSDALTRAATPSFSLANKPSLLTQSGAQNSRPRFLKAMIFSSLVILLLIVTLILGISARNEKEFLIITQELPRTTATSKAPASLASPSASSPTGKETLTNEEVFGDVLPTPLVYRVREGDTCSKISFSFGVPLENVLNTNRLSEDCPLFASQILLIPEPGRTPTPSSIAIVTPTEKNKTDVTVFGADEMPMVYIPAGAFLIGSADSDQRAGEDERPQHWVYVDAFWVDVTEVTNKMYSRCVAEGFCLPPLQRDSNSRSFYYGNENYLDYPVIHVSWYMAQAYCQWNDKRLPTEAEWEKAARGVDGKEFPWGNMLPNSTLANFDNRVGDTTPVKTYPLGISSYGLYDMAGNVSEWVEDWYDESYYQIATIVNPFGPLTGQFKVLRGGSWFSSARTLRTAFRLWNYPSQGFEGSGFRCVRSE